MGCNLFAWAFLKSGSRCVKNDLPRKCVCVAHKPYRWKVKMNSKLPEEEVVFDVGSLYARLQGLKDRHKPIGIRYARVVILVMGVMSKLGGEDTPSGMADWDIENGLHYRCDVILREDRTRMTEGNARRIMACLNNLVIGLVSSKTRFVYLLPARRFFDAHPAYAFARLTRR